MTAPVLDSLPLHNRTLWLSTLVFGWCFAIWTLYAFAGVNWQAQWQLSATELGILLASPMLSGALLRLPAGLLAQRFGGKTGLVVCDPVSEPSSLVFGICTKLQRLPTAWSLARYRGSLFYLGQYSGDSPSSRVATRYSLRYFRHWERWRHRILVVVLVC